VSGLFGVSGVAEELGDGLGALGDGVLGELPGKDEANGGLDFTGSQSALLVVAGNLAALGGDALEHVVREGVHDGHGLGADAGLLVNGLEDLVDVDAVGLLPLGPALLSLALLETVTSLVSTTSLGGLVLARGLPGLVSARCILRHVGSVGDGATLVRGGVGTSVTLSVSVGTSSVALSVSVGSSSVTLSVSSLVDILLGLGVVGLVGSHLDEVVENGRC